jgi:hypothetical protein
MCVERRARIDRALDLFGRRMCVADRNMDALLDQCCDVRIGLAEVRRQRDHADVPTGRMLPPLKLCDGRWAHSVGRMGTPVSIQR